MHELSIAEGILSTIENQLGCVKPLIQVNLSVGPLSGISADSLEFWFTEVAKQKGFGSPKLIIKKNVATSVCSTCNLEYEISSFYSGCPKCGSFTRTMASGQECIIDTIELEDDSNV
jgi:hydrogenase nickel incorporation protein HypA/HybF